MKLRLITALLVATMAYTLTVIVGIITRSSLEETLITGLTTLLFWGAMAWLVVYFLQVLAHKESKPENKDKIKDDQRQTTAGIQGDVGDFTPLSPPILEVNNLEKGEES